MAFAKLLSGRVTKVTGSNLDSDRSEYISLGNAEPDFGLPDSDNAILSSLSNGTRQFLYPGTGIAIDSGDIDVDVTTTTFNSSGFNHTTSTDLYNVIKDLDQVIGQVTGTDSSGGGAASVLTDSSIDGNGTTGSPLSLHPNVTGLTLLTVDNLKLDGNTLSSTDVSNTLYIDPAPVNDNGGTLVVKGNLQVDGTTTTVNSTTVSINDKNIVLADSAANATEADGAGITVNGANATIIYNSTNDAWKLNKDLRLDDNVSAYFGNSGDLRIYHDGNNSRIRDEGAGELRLEYSQLRLWDTSGVTNLIAYSGGGVDLYHNGTKKIGTVFDGVEIPDGQLILGDDSASIDWRIGNGSNDRLIFTIQGTGGPEMELRNDSAANYQDASLYVGGNRVLTTADPGSGNALDADTVDGLHASQFLRSDSDDTATGRIYLSGGAGIGSSDNASYDLYNNGTTYLNGTTTIDADTTISGSSSKLTILSQQDEKLILKVASGDSTKWNYMSWKDSDNTRLGYLGTNQNGDMILAGERNGNELLSTSNGWKVNQNFYVDGNVGVKTTSPGLPLDVNGTIRSNDAVRLTNTGQFTDNTATTTSTSQTVIAQWSATTFGGGKVIVEAKDGSNRHISELLITHNGTTASATEYGTVHTSGSLATYDVDISGGNVRLLATPASTNSTAYKMMNTLLFS